MISPINLDYRRDIILQLAYKPISNPQPRAHMTGKLIKDISNTLSSEQKAIDVSQLIPNTYILRIDGKSLKFIKK